MIIEANINNEVVRVLLVMHNSGKGGVETALGTLCKYLNRERVHLTVIVPKEGPFKDKVEALGIEVLQAPLELWIPTRWEFGERHYYRFLASLRDRIEHFVNIINKRKIDVVHSSTLTILDGALAARIAQKPHIWNIRELYENNFDLSFKSYFPKETVFNIVNNLSTRIVTISQTVKNSLVGYIPTDKIEVILNGIDVAQFDDKIKKSSILVKEFPKLSGKLIVALIGRISPVKGIEDFINAAFLVNQKRQDIGFIIVGPVNDKKLFEKVKTMLDEQKISDQVFFAGQREDIPEILREIDLSVCSSISEGLSNSCLEAMAASKPVVATRCGGTEEIICDGVNGYLTPVGNPAELSVAILKAFEDLESLRLMGFRGKNMAIKKFNPYTYALNYEYLYMQLSKNNLNNFPIKKSSDDVFLCLASSFGQLGERNFRLEKEVRDLKSLVDTIKNNIFYRFIKSSLKKLKYFE